MADSLNPTEPFDVDMDHLTRGFLFVANDLGLGVKRGQGTETTGFSDAGYSGARRAA